MARAGWQMTLRPYRQFNFANYQALRSKCPTMVQTNKTRKIKNRILAIPAAAKAIPEKPRNAAIKAKTKKPSA